MDKGKFQPITNIAAITLSLAILAGCGKKDTSAQDARVQAQQQQAEAQRIEQERQQARADSIGRASRYADSLHNDPARKERIGRLARKWEREMKFKKLKQLEQENKGKTSPDTSKTLPKGHALGSLPLPQRPTIALRAASTATPAAMHLQARQKILHARC